MRGGGGRGSGKVVVVIVVAVVEVVAAGVAVEVVAVSGYWLGQDVQLRGPKYPHLNILVNFVISTILIKYSNKTWKLIKLI